MQKDLTVTELAYVLRLHPKSVRRHLRSGHLPSAYRLGPRGQWRVPLAAIEAFKGPCFASQEQH